MTVTPIRPPKEQINRLINWLTVCRVERDENGVVIYFVDGNKIRDSRDMETIWKLIEKHWSVRL